MANLTSDQLAQLMQAWGTGNTNGAGGFSPIYIQSGDNTGNQLLGFGGNYSGYTPGSTYDLYGTDGSYAGQRQVENGGSLGDLLKGTFKDLAPAAAMVAGGYGLSSLLGGLGAGAGLAGDATAIGYDPLAFGTGGVLDPATGELVGGAGAAGGGTAAMGAGAAGGAGATGAGSTAAGAAGTTAAGATSVLGGAGSLIAPALGALAGSQAQKTTQQQDIPSWLKPYVLGSSGNPGLLGNTSSLLAAQMSPGYMAGFDQMRNLGQQMMSSPIAGNGFNKFFPNFTGFTGGTGLLQNGTSGAPPVPQMLPAANSMNAVRRH